MRSGRLLGSVAVNLLALGSLGNVSLADSPAGSDLETFASICEEKELTRDEMLGEETLVIDLDSLRQGGETLEFDDGTMIRLQRSPDGALALTLVEGQEESSDPCHDHCPNRELRPVPLAEADRFDAEVADFQIRYAGLLAEGKREEAETLATEFLAGDARESTSDVPRKLAASVTRSANPILEHQVSYDGRLRTPHRSESSIARWEDVSRRTITLRFKGATLDDVANFLRLATGLVVDVDVNDEIRQETQIHLECNDDSLESALDALSRVTRLQFLPGSDRIVIRSSR